MQSFSRHHKRNPRRAGDLDLGGDSALGLVDVDALLWSKQRLPSYQDFLADSTRSTPCNALTSREPSSLQNHPMPGADEACSISHETGHCCTSVTWLRHKRRGLCFCSLWKPGRSYRNNKFRRVILAAFLTRKQPLHTIVAIPSMILLSVLNP